MSRPRIQAVLGGVAIAACAFFLSGSARAGTTGQLQGTVRDAKTGEPIGLASVAIPELKRGAVTDAQGSYFILNVPAGRYSVRVSLLGYIPQVRGDVEVIPDFSTRLEFTLESTVLKDVAEVVVTAQRPLIQKDVTGSTKFLSGSDIRNQPLRGYQDAVAQQSGVVNFKLNIDNEAQNNNTLIIRGGRPNEVAYYVDGFSQQDPLTGVSTTLINSDAIQEIVVQTGGFNAEYGRINSGAINVVTKEGGDRYFGSVEGITDNLSGDWLKAKARDNNTYGLSLGGPIAPSLRQATFYLSGERKYNRDRRPSWLTEDVTDPSQPGLFEDGILPSNWSDSWASIGKLTWKPSPLRTVKLGGTYNRENWQQYLNSYRFDLTHAPRYRDTNYSVYGTWNHSLTDRSFYDVKANFFSTERIRGDGRYFENLEQYAFAANPDLAAFHGIPTENPRFDPNEALFWFADDPTTTEYDAHVWDDFLHRKSSYWGVSANYANQVTRSIQVKVGADYQRHTLRYYNHYFPVQLYVIADSAGTLGISNTNDVDRYGYDALGNEIDEGETFADANGNGSYDVGETFVDSNANGIYDSTLDGPKHPKVASAYAQAKYEQLGLVLNAGLRFDYLTPSTEALRSEIVPLDPDGLNDARLQEGDLEESKVYRRLSPRLGVGFPVSDRTLVHVNYGKFFQQPNLQDLYVSYAFLEHKVRTGGYFVGFGNPNLKPEETTAYEVGLAHTPTERSRIDVAAYYKDVKDLVEISNIPSAPNNFSSYRNRDYATIKGIDLGYTLRRVGHVSVNASYSLSYASGTGSVSQSQRDIAWTADSIPKLTSPLDFDQRHKFSLNLDYRMDKGEGLTLGETHIFENAGINVLVNAGSGTPFTPTKVHNEVTIASVAQEPIGPLNSRYGPWTVQVDLKATKAISLGRQRLGVFVWVLNVFDKDNVNTVYGSSGSAETTNFLNTEEGQNFLDTNAGTYGMDGAIQRYRLAERNPNLHGVPRLVRFGASLSF